jgi:hypothetical protein
MNRTLVDQRAPPVATILPPILVLVPLIEASVFEATTPSTCCLLRRDPRARRLRQSMLPRFAWLLNSRFRILAPSFRLLAPGSWLLAPGSWLLVANMHDGD